MAEPKPLSPQREVFALAVVSGKKPVDAYREAFPKSKTWKPDSLHNKSSALMRDARVMARIAELRAPVVAKAVLTLETHLAKLQELRDKADAAEEYGAAIKAEELRGKVSGFYVTKTEDVTDPIKKAMGRMDPARAQELLDGLEQVEAVRKKAKAKA